MRLVLKKPGLQLRGSSGRTVLINLVIIMTPELVPKRSALASSMASAVDKSHTAALTPTPGPTVLFQRSTSCTLAPDCPTTV